MRVLVACEESGVVRDAFATRGHDAWSCDLQPSRRGGQHLQGTILDRSIASRGWDLMIAHPDCTFLTVSGNRWLVEDGWRRNALMSSLHFVWALWDFPIRRIAIENPIGRLSTLWMPPTQTIQPHDFGHGERKATCLWLKNLPPLTPTDPVDGREQRVWKMPPGPNRKRDRSETYQGIADAMAEQWGIEEITH